MAEWLRKGRHLPWLEAEAERPARTPFLGPPDLRAAVVAAKGEDWTAAWLDACGWQDIPTPAICPRSGFAAKSIEREISSILRRFGVSIAETEAAA